MLLDKTPIHTYDTNVTSPVVLKILNVKDLILQISCVIIKYKHYVVKKNLHKNNIITKDEDLAILLMNVLATSLKIEVYLEHQLIK